jgi:hypothetical protein
MEELVLLTHALEDPRQAMTACTLDHTQKIPGVTFMVVLTLENNARTFPHFPLIVPPWQLLVMI